MKGALALRDPVSTMNLNLTSSPISTGAWVEIEDSLPNACSAIEMFNPSNASLQISTGAVGQESAHILPYTILPGGSAQLAVNISKGKRISLKSLDNPAASGLFTINTFG